MKPSHDTLRVLLVQARNTPRIERQEQLCFLERCRLEEEQLVTANVVREALDLRLLEAVDAVMIGGAGEYSATRDYPWLPPVLELCHEVRRLGMPTFGSCWGHQLLARAYGGTVVYDHERAELGCAEMHLTEAGGADALFRGLPARFVANTGHHDRVLELPPGAVELARNASQPYQAFRMEGLPIYGTQFHSELSADRERERLIAYRDYYRRELESEERFQLILRELQDTTEVDHLLYDFLQAFSVQ